MAGANWAPGKLNEAPSVISSDGARGPGPANYNWPTSRTRRRYSGSPPSRALISPHRCSTRDQRHLTDNSPIKPEALGLVKTFWKTAVGMVLERLRSRSRLPAPCRGVTPSDGSKFQPKITCSEGHAICNLELTASSATQRMSARRYS
jgi:hypothetical protein